jgi:hypothetical protein
MLSVTTRWPRSRRCGTSTSIVVGERRPVWACRLISVSGHNRRSPPFSFLRAHASHHSARSSHRCWVLCHRPPPSTYVAVRAKDLVRRLLLYMWHLVPARVISQRRRELLFSTAVFLRTSSPSTADLHPPPAQPRVPQAPPSTSAAHRPKVPLRPPPVRTADDRLSATVFLTSRRLPRWAPLHLIGLNRLRRFWASPSAPPSPATRCWRAGISDEPPRGEGESPVFCSEPKVPSGLGPIPTGWVECPVDWAHCNSGISQFPLELFQIHFKTSLNFRNSLELEYIQ